MNRLNTSSSTLLYSNCQFGPGPIRRLIVLIPTDADYTATMDRISDLAIAFRADVLLLGRCTDTADELSLRRELITLSALLQQDARVYAKVNVENKMSWVDLVTSNYQAGDLVVCFAEQYVGLLHRPLSQILSSNFGAPVYILSSLSPQSPVPSNWLAKIVTWTGFAGIIAGVLLLQVQMMSIPKDWARTATLILSVLVELWLIWAWNRLFS